MKWLIYGKHSFSGASFGRWLQGQRHQVELRSLRESDPPLLIDDDYDVVINFSALNVVHPSWQAMRHYVRVNVGKTGSLFETLVKANVKRYIHVSTPEVYGPAKPFKPVDYVLHHAIGLTEEQPFDPSTPYAATRAASEMLLKCYERRYGLKAIVTRACNIYGPGQQHYRLIPKLIASIKKGIPFPLEGGGQSRRSFLYIDDYCQALELLGRYGEPGKAYHISEQNTQSIWNVVASVCRAMNVRVEDVIQETPPRPAQDPEYWLDTHRINMLGWKPSTSLEAGIGKTIAWMDANWNKIRDWPMEYEVQP